VPITCAALSGSAPGSVDMRRIEVLLKAALESGAETMSTASKLDGRDKLLTVVCELLLLLPSRSTHFTIQ
jgi:hypothetical protein